MYNEKLIKAKNDKKILVATHRGTHGGNIIQNTCMAYKNSILHGADIVETDLIMSTDGDFYILHNGEEKRWLDTMEDIRTFSTERIESLEYHNQYGIHTGKGLDKAAETFEALRGKCFINVDRTWFYWKETIEFLHSLNMPEQIILKSPATDELLQVLQDSKTNIMYMPIIRTVEEWQTALKYDINIVAAEILFDDTNSPLVQKAFLDELDSKNILKWVNTINLGTKGMLSGGFDDNTSIEKGFDAGYGKLYNMGFDVFQTDWPALVDKFRTNL